MIRIKPFIILLVIAGSAFATTKIPAELMQPTKTMTEMTGLLEDGSHDPSNIILYKRKYYGTPIM